MKSALCVWGGWTGHEPQPCMSIFESFLRAQGYVVTVADTLDVYLNAPLLGAQSVIAQCWTMGTLTREQETGLL